jgi:hypothetical protein
MRAPAAPFPDDRQRQSLQRFQQALSRGTGGSPLRVAAIPPGQPCVGSGQALADDKFQPRQHPPQQCRELDGTHRQTARRRMGADPAEHAGDEEPLQKNEEIEDILLGVTYTGRTPACQCRASVSSYHLHPRPRCSLHSCGLQVGTWICFSREVPLFPWFQLEYGGMLL